MYSERLENQATVKAGELVKSGILGEVVFRLLQLLIQIFLRGLTGVVFFFQQIMVTIGVLSIMVY